MPETDSITACTCPSALLAKQIHLPLCPLRAKRPEPVRVTVAINPPLLASQANTPKQKAETQKAITKAERAANKDWLLLAYEVGRELALKFREFTSAEIDLWMMRFNPDITTRDKRAMGGVVLGLIRKGVVEKTGAFESDPRDSCHRQNKAVLRSLIFKDNR